MSEKIISPGVLTKEIDASFLPAALGNIGAAIIGPCVKGPILVPTIINNPTELDAIFGTTYESSSGANFEYFTTLTAKNYLKYKGPVTIVRVAGNGSSKASNSSFGPADVDTWISSSLHKNMHVQNVSDKGAILSSIDENVIGLGSGTHTDANQVADYAKGQIFFGPGIHNNTSMSFAGVEFRFKKLAEATASAHSSTFITVSTGSNTTHLTENLRDSINNSGSLHGLTSYVSASAWSSSPSSSYLSLTSSVAGAYYSGSQLTRWNNRKALQDLTIDCTASGSIVTQVSSGSYNLSKLCTPFKLHALTEGSILNNQNENTASSTSFKGEHISNDLIKSGSKHNFRWEIQDVNNSRGTFTLLIRRGNDTRKRKLVLEQWTDLSLDPTQNNYIARVIGDQVQTLRGSGTTEPYIQVSGSFVNKSKYVRVEVMKQTPNYLDENGNLTNPEASASLPAEGSGSQGGGFANGSDGNIQEPINFYEKITETNTQGLNPTSAANGKTSYEDAINLLRNQDEYDINLLFMPGLTSNNHGALINKAVDMCEDRQDTFFVFDCSDYDSNVTTATSQAEGFDTNYAATYWPWVQITDSESKLRWIPPSVAVSEVLSFNDKVAQPWFAPAGLNRGKVTAIQTERKLLESQRNTLYKSNVNPIATFPGQGVVVFGQKTLQKKLSALDRINVRRLLIRVKKFIASSSRFLLFEQNTPALRKSFLNIAQPFLERVKSQSGLSAFKVVMDDTNNTANTIDRNQLIGQIYLQPTKTAEFIMLDFTIQRTGASFEE
tara:strand:- start:113 stop:2446 length:2334 start_codon:yes stop_codon:yes gene_type:complete